MATLMVKSKCDPDSTYLSDWAYNCLNREQAHQIADLGGVKGFVIDVLGPGNGPAEHVGSSVQEDACAESSPLFELQRGISVMKGLHRGGRCADYYPGKANLHGQ